MEKQFQQSIKKRSSHNFFSWGFRIIGCFFIAEIATKEKSKKEIHILKRGTEK